MVLEESLVWLRQIIPYIESSHFYYILKIFNRSYSFYASLSKSFSEPNLRDYELWTWWYNKNYKIFYISFNNL